MIIDADLITFFTSSLILALTPGNDVLFVATHSLGLGVRAGVAAACGVSVGIIFHTLVLALGLSKIFISFPWVLQGVKVIGCIYLLYLGFTAFRTSSSTESVEMKQAKTHLSVFYKGVLTNVLNPKVALFFLAFIPQFVKPERETFFSQFLFLGILFFAIGIVINLLYALLFARSAHLLKQNSKFKIWIHRISGLIFCGLAIKIFF
jgi:threonine/homoserine/homoserine lactone efflux protein